jgi:hypothetical protein
MKRLMVYLMVIGLLLAACSTPAGPVVVPTEVAPTPAEPTPAKPTPTDEPAAEDVPAANAVVQALAALLGLDAGQIKVVSVEEVEWSDSCLGIVYIDAICAAGVVPGYRIVLEANGLQFEYHTNADGTARAIAPATPETAAEAAVEAARAALARALGLPDYRVTLAGWQPVEWPDACLGVVRMGVLCAQGVTPGYRLMLQANEQLFEYHTNADGTALASAPANETLAATPAVQAALAALMKALGLTEAQIHVVSVAPRVWSDACLGVAVPGQACAEVVTPGYNVVLGGSEGQVYEYHTNQDGSSVQAASVAVTWNRHGGIAGFCDELLIYRSGEVVAHNCDNEALAQTTLAALSESDVAQFNDWLTKFGQVNVAQDDGAVADSMSINFSLIGTGAEQPTEADQQALMQWAQTVYTQVQPAA